MSNTPIPASRPAKESQPPGGSGRPRSDVASPDTATSTAVDGNASSTASYLWWGLAALSLIIGFVDLWRGGTTISATALTIGYLVLVPVAILKR